MEKWLTDYMDHGNAYSDTATICKPRPQPMMNRRTIMMFDTTVGGKKYWPYLNRKNLTEGVDPGFMMAPSNQDGIKAFLLGRWLTGANIDWAYNISEDLDGIWPMNENLSYTNTTLKTAAMGGFPLGDLFHWWPAAYAQWKAQRTTENTNLSNWLKNGLTEVRLLDGNVVPAEYALSQNYPNPFNPTTQIDYSIPQSGLVSLKVYDLLGKEVKTLYEGVQSAGNYVATFDGSKFTGGVYFYRLQTDNFSMTKKLVLIK
jgi:hypothetical protein